MSSRSIFTAVAVTILLAAPAVAQHGGGMGGMHGTMPAAMSQGQMNEYMGQMMTHMTQMMSEMQTLQGELHQDAAGPMSQHLQQVNGELENTVPRLQGMLQAMQEYLQSDDAAVRDNPELVQSMAQGMEGMLQSGLKVMSSMHDLNAVQQQASGR